MLEMEAESEATTPTWMSFADLMTGLLGAFVLLLVGVMATQLEMASKLEAEVQKRQIEEQKRQTLEQALAIPLASGRITLNNGRIGISGKLLFELNSRPAAARRPQATQKPGRTAQKLPRLAR